MLVEKLNIEDQVQWQELYRGYADFYKMPMNEDILSQVWGWIFDEEMEFYALSAKTQDGTMVGFMHYRQMPSPLRGILVGFLDDLYVSPENRGGGAVQSLFKALNEDAKKNNWQYVRWITATDNNRARAVYDKISDTIDFVTYQMPAR
ncbi:MAG: GNAT family N-acetyltransferase [PS1 clade bacterium]